MKLLVLGGTKFLGRHLVEAALARGHELIAEGEGGPGTRVLAGANVSKAVGAGLSFRPAAETAVVRARLSQGSLRLRGLAL